MKNFPLMFAHSGKTNPVVRLVGRLVGRTPLYLVHVWPGITKIKKSGLARIRNYEKTKKRFWENENLQNGWVLLKTKE